MTAAGCRHKKYDNPIAKDTQQPDKVLFDTAMHEIEKGQYEQARLHLQTMMNTYDTSEFLAKAKLAYADSWYREGGSHGLAQAEAEYKDFQIFYPQMEEAAEAQEKICKMQYQQMDKSDRDPAHAFRADEECRSLLTQYPNSKFAPQATQMVREIQEVLADREFKVGAWYFQSRGAMASAANRLQALTDQFPLYSRADDALWMEADAYQRMGDRFEEDQASALTKIVRDYPLSAHVEEAKSRLTSMNRPVPQADPVAYAREKYELENRGSRSLMSKVWGPFADHPSLNNAATSGTPEMSRLNPTVPRSVPPTAIQAQQTENKVTVEQPSDPNVLDNSPDAIKARNAAANGGAATGAEGATGSTAVPSAGAAGATGTTGSTAAASPDKKTDAAAAPPAANNGKGKAKTPKPPKTPKKKSKKSDSTSQSPAQTPPPQDPAKPAGGGQTPAAPAKQ